MNDLLITAAEVLETAFPSNEYIPEEMIVPTRIETAQLEFLRPAFGKLYDKLGEEPYATFCRTYIKPALAYYVRYLMVDEQCAAIGAAGVRQNKSSYTEAVPDSRLHRLRRQARNDADTLLDKAIDYVENNPAMFPEYDPKENIRHRILIKGGFIL